MRTPIAPTQQHTPGPNFRHGDGGAAPIARIARACVGAWIAVAAVALTACAANEATPASADPVARTSASSVPAAPSSPQPSAAAPSRTPEAIAAAVDFNKVAGGVTVSLATVDPTHFAVGGQTVALADLPVVFRAVMKRHTASGGTAETITLRVPDRDAVWRSPTGSPPVSVMKLASEAGFLQFEVEGLAHSLERE
ncbi:MAG: hypothetical protein U0414_08885 [Polyangiaceae bacterium]